jgi:sulfur carrier protein
MEVTINGEKTNLDGTLTVSELLVSERVKMPEMVSVELNGRILRRSEFNGIQIKGGDAVEFLYFMGGGSVTD